MRTGRMLLVGSLALGLFAAGVLAGEAKQIKCSGKVTDKDGKPVSGAKVSLYEMYVEETAYKLDLKLCKESVAGEEGTFEFVFPDSKDENSKGFIVVARAPQLALGWGNIQSNISQLENDVEMTIELVEGADISGVVVENSGSAVAGAKVGVAIMLKKDKEGKQVYLMGYPGADFLLTESDAEGKFTLSGLPVDATLELQVSKNGYGAVSTFGVTGYSGQQLTFASGQDDIKITLPPAARIEGKVVKKGTDEGVAEVSFYAMNSKRPQILGGELVVSAEDGTFVVENLSGGDYILMIPSSRGGTAQWISAPVEVAVEDGKTAGGVKVEVSKGGVVEVMVTDDSKPVDKASVNLRGSDGTQRFYSVTDANGLARIRVAPGQYVISAGKQGYTFSSGQKVAAVAEGQTVQQEIQLQGQPKVTGAVTDPEGKPVAGAAVKIMPLGQETVKTDSEGKYEARWDPRMWAGDVPAMYLVVRHLERNLGKVVAIFEDTTQMDIRLDPGVVACGIVTDANDKPIENAKIILRLSVSRYSSHISDSQECRSGAEGRFEVKAIPVEQKYTVNVSADGYGTSDSDFHANDANQGRIDIGQVKLGLANLSISGVVVDSDEAPIEGAQVMGYGTGQPQVRATTDKEGKFVLEGVCAGRIELNVHVSGGSYRYGRAMAEGGDTDVWITMREPSGQSAVRDPASLVGRQLPDMKALGIEPLPDANGKMVLAVFWDMAQRPSRHCVTELAKMADELAGKGVLTVVVQASEADKEALRDWIQQYKMPFPSGMLGEEAEKVRFAWGVESLPWLILTDAKHIVKANGFALGELRAKIDEIKQ